MRGGYGRGDHGTRGAWYEALSFMKSTRRPGVATTTGGLQTRAASVGWYGMGDHVACMVTPYGRVVCCCVLVCADVCMLPSCAVVCCRTDIC